MTGRPPNDATGSAAPPAGPPSRAGERDGRAAEAPSDVAYRTKAVVGALIVVANLVGAGLLVGLAGWVLPFRVLVADQADALRVNLLLFGVYAPLGAAMAFAVGWSWMRIPDPPGPGASEAARDRHRARARRVVLRGPLRLAVVQAVPWLVGVLLFAAVDARWSATLAVAVACMIALGGITTVTVAYRLTELALRREVARVFVLQPPTGNGVPGVALRSLGTWVMGTGVPLLGLVIAAGTSLTYSKYFSVDRLGLVTLVLALLALAVGFLVTALTSTSLAASVLAVRRALRRVEDGDLDVTVEVTDTTELGLLQSGFNTMVAGLRERDRVRELFGQQVGEDVAAAAVAGQVELGGEVRDVAVLFVDLVGSTHLAATLPADRGHGPPQPVLRRGRRRRRGPRRVDQQVRGRRRARRLRRTHRPRRRGRRRPRRRPRASRSARARRRRPRRDRGLGRRGRRGEHRGRAALRVHRHRRSGERGRPAL